MKYYVKKLCCVNPRNKYHFISLDIALDNYQAYVYRVLYSQGVQNIKTFRDWLKTEL